MQWISDFYQAIIIMILGMAVTFFFLSILVVMIHISSKIIAKYLPEPEPAFLTNKETLNKNNEGAVIAAITIAVNKYLKDKEANNFRR